MIIIMDAACCTKKIHLGGKCFDTETVTSLKPPPPPPPPPLAALVHDATHARTPAKFLNSLIGSLLQGFLSSMSNAATNNPRPIELNIAGVYLMGCSPRLGGLALPSSPEAAGTAPKSRDEL